jgi:hypothetical protein
MVDSTATAATAGIAATEHLGADGGTVPDAYYVRLDGGRFHSTLHSQGAWNDHEQHMAPASGLIVHELLRNHPRPEMVMSRINFEILGIIHGGEFEIQTRVLRPGKTIELLEATFTAQGRTAIRAQAWRLVTGDTAAVAGTFSRPLSGPRGCPPAPMTSVWDGGFIRSTEFRTAADLGPGNRTVWARTLHPLVEGEDSHPLARFVSIVDTANGIAVRQDPREYMFPNLDLTIHLFRQPQGEWTGLDTRVSFGADGVGLTDTELFDEQGPVGRAAQILTVRKFPGSVG